MDDAKDNPLSYIRKESLDIYNRLHSIAEDSTFIQEVQEAYPGAPVLPNLRCGAWYTKPDIATDIPAYFKSTDGHFNNWNFNLRRANIHLLDLISKFHIMILVDSTRSGKRIPDALSKTVPIWCAVVNRALIIRYPDLDLTAWDAKLYTPPAIISKQEHDQIEQRLDGWAEALAASSFCLPKLPRPLRPLWITPTTATFPKLCSDRAISFIPIVCVSASKRVVQGVERRPNGFTYVQGSGDDHELWGMGLTPTIFWKHYKELLGTTRSDLPEAVRRIVHVESISPQTIIADPTPVAKIGGRLALCTLSELSSLNSSGDVDFNYIILTPSNSHQNSQSRLFMPTLSGKKGQADFLNIVLPTSIDFIRDRLYKGSRVCIACETGKDLSVGVVLAALQVFFEDDGSLRTAPPKTNDLKIDKPSIRTRLEWVITSRPQANPSRATLKRVNEFLLTPPALRRVLLPPPEPSMRKPIPQSPMLSSGATTTPDILE